MKRILLLLFISLWSYGLLAQTTQPTKSFVVKGNVKNEISFTIDDLKKLPALNIGTVVITNHMGEKKSEAKDLKGVLLRDVFKTIEINSESPKVLSEYYFVCKATDGYKVVFSWNEIFNTTVGDSIYIITEKNGKKLEEIDDSILLLSPKDFKTGRRHVKSLSTIEVRRAN
jgi:hypothetical protein